MRIGNRRHACTDVNIGTRPDRYIDIAAVLPAFARRGYPGVFKCHFTRQVGQYAPAGPNRLRQDPPGAMTACVNGNFTQINQNIAAGPTVDAINGGTFNMLVMGGNVTAATPNRLSHEGWAAVTGCCVCTCTWKQRNGTAITPGATLGRNDQLIALLPIHKPLGHIRERRVRRHCVGIRMARTGHLGGTQPAIGATHGGGTPAAAD